MSDLAMPHSSPATALSTPRANGAIFWLAVLAAITTIALTAAAFWLSYEHLHDVAATHGLASTPSRAWAWPATVDLFIVVGELLILRASLKGSTDGWAIALAALGSGGSIALNVAGVGPDAPALHYVVAAVPPVAALLAFGALMRQIHGVLAARPAHGEQPTEQAPETPEQPPVKDEQPEPLPEAPTEQPERDRFLSTREVADRYGVTMSTVGTWLDRGIIERAFKDPRRGNLYDPETLPPLTTTS
ncbi:DUF2637 domain-containing protein [Streptomyces sp. NPDC056543]|uniref:DUF2637 domain-containing protein n=1 Tax=unclassified Streptomyces TaxID=2593676 RepID=UPI003680E186